MLQTAVSGHTTSKVGICASIAVRSSWAELEEILHPAVSSQHLPHPILVTTAVLCLTAGWYLGISGPVGSAPQSGRREERQLASLRDLSLPLPCAYTTRRRRGSSGDPVVVHQAATEGTVLQHSNVMRVTPVSTLPPDDNSAQHQVHHFSLSTIFALPRWQHYTSGVWRGWSRARQR